MLYSLSGFRPAPLPSRIRLPGGFTRTDPSTFTAEEILAAGYVGPYTEPPYDPAKQQLDWVDGAYVISPLPPPPPEPRWQEFGAALMSDPAINTMLSQAIATAPGIYGGLVAGMGQAAQGDPSTLGTAWGLATAAGLVSPELAASVAAMAASYDLPAELSQILAPAQEASPAPKPSGWNPPPDPARGATYQALDGSWWRWDQPRDPATGQFLADDSDTPEIESALDWQPFNP